MSTACEQLVNLCQQNSITDLKTEVFRVHSFWHTGSSQDPLTVEHPLGARRTRFPQLVHTNKKKKNVKK